MVVSAFGLLDGLVLQLVKVDGNKLLTIDLAVFENVFVQVIIVVGNVTVLSQFVQLFLVGSREQMGQCLVRSSICNCAGVVLVNIGEGSVGFFVVDRRRIVANVVTLPSSIILEGARTISFARVFGRAASATGRVFGHFASVCLFARCLAVAQACFEAFDVVTHAN